MAVVPVQSCSEFTAIKCSSSASVGEMVETEADAVSRETRLLCLWRGVRGGEGDVGLLGWDVVTKYYSTVLGWRFLFVKMDMSWSYF